MTGYGLAVTSGILAMLYPLTHHQLFYWGSTTGWNLRVQCMSLGKKGKRKCRYCGKLHQLISLHSSTVNRKLLSLTAGSLAHVTTGHCITLMSNDVRRFDELFVYFPFLTLVTSSVAFSWMLMDESILMSLFCAPRLRRNSCWLHYSFLLS